MRFVTLTLLALTLAACSEQPGNPPPQSVKSGSTMATTNPQAPASGATTARLTPEIDQRERKALEQSTQLASRDGRTLKLTLQSGKTVEFTDSPNCDSYEVCQKHVYGGLIADQRFFYVKTHFYEGSMYRLLSQKTGEEVEIFDVPQVSPDGKFIVTAGDDIAYDDSGAFLWEISNGKLVQRHAQDHRTNLLYRFVRWHDSNRVELIRLDGGDEKRCEGKFIRVPVYMVIGPGEFWKFEEDTDQSKRSCSD